MLVRTASEAGTVRLLLGPVWSSPERPGQLGQAMRAVRCDDKEKVPSVSKSAGSPSSSMSVGSEVGACAGEPGGWVGDGTGADSAESGWKLIGGDDMAVSVS